MIAPGAGYLAAAFLLGVVVGMVVSISVEMEVNVFR